VIAHPPFKWQGGYGLVVFGEPGAAVVVPGGGAGLAHFWSTLSAQASRAPNTIRIIIAIGTDIGLPPVSVLPPLALERCRGFLMISNIFVSFASGGRGMICLPAPLLHCLKYNR